MKELGKRACTKGSKKLGKKVSTKRNKELGKKVHKKGGILSDRTCRELVSN